MHNSSFHRAREISFVSTNRFEQSLVQVLGKGTVVTQRHSGRSRDILLTSPLRDSGDYRAIQIQRMIKRSRRSVSGASSSASRLFNYIYQVVGSERTRRAARSRVRSSRTLSLSLSLLFRKKKEKENHRGWIFTGEKIRWYAAWRASYINEQTLPSSQGRAVIIVRSLPRSITLFFPLDRVPRTYEVDGRSHPESMP